MKLATTITLAVLTAAWTSAAPIGTGTSTINVLPAHTGNTILATRGWPSLNLGGSLCPTCSGVSGSISDMWRSTKAAFTPKPKAPARDPLASTSEENLEHFNWARDVLFRALVWKKDEAERASQHASPRFNDPLLKAHGMHTSRTARIVAALYKRPVLALPGTRASRNDHSA